MKFTSSFLSSLLLSSKASFVAAAREDPITFDGSGSVDNNMYVANHGVRFIGFNVYVDNVGNPAPSLASIGQIEVAAQFVDFNGAPTTVGSFEMDVGAQANRATLRWFDPDGNLLGSIPNDNTDPNLNQRMGGSGGNIAEFRARTTQGFVTIDNLVSMEALPSEQPSSPPSMRPTEGPTSIPVQPEALDDSTVTEINTPTVIYVVTNELDLNPTLDPTTAAAISVPTSGGSVTNNADGSISYTPATDYVGIDSFDYRVCNTGGLCDQATVTVLVVDPDVVNDKVST